MDCWRRKPQHPIRVFLLSLKKQRNTAQNTAAGWIRMQYIESLFFGFLEKKEHTKTANSMSAKWLGIWCSWGTPNPKQKKQNQTFKKTRRRIFGVSLKYVFGFHWMFLVPSSKNKKNLCFWWLLPWSMQSPMPPQKKLHVLFGFLVLKKKGDNNAKST